MPEYNYLKHNESAFPHINNVDVYKYDNSLDYGRFDYTQMILQVCAVPWDMGEAHIGNRTISGIGNVVYFGSKEERDNWFDSIPDSECYRFTTKFKELHKSLQIDVPIPYDVCAKYNYLRVEYAKFANENSPVEYEEPGGLNEWFWFIREVEFLAPNTTRLILMPDAWQTWIYDVDITGMFLERGHAPMFAIRADQFLQYPIDNNDYLLTDDVNFGECSNVKHIDACVLNTGEMYACISTTANPTASWGTKYTNNWTVPTMSAYTNNGIPSNYVFATAVNDFNSLLSVLDNNIPQFKQTIQAVFFASKTILNIGESFTIYGIKCYKLSSNRKTLDFIELEKDMFGYPTRYADMAKLYTEPYAHIEITDENGDTDIIKIEDTEGIINVSVSLSLAYPFLNIDSHLLGVGGNGHATVTFKNIETHDFPISGTWYNTLRSWNVPTFNVILSAAQEYDYQTHFDRTQAQNEYNTQRSNTYDSANTLVANANLNASTNTTLASISNTSASTVADNAIGYNASVTIADNGATIDSALSTIASADMQGAITAASGFVGGAIGSLGISSATNQPTIGVSGLTNAVIGSINTLASTAIGNGLTMALAADTIGANNRHQNASDTKTRGDLSAQTTATSDSASAHNSYITGSASNTAATQKGIANRNANTTEEGLQNGIRQGRMQPPTICGNAANGESAANKPIGLFAHIITQSKSAISSAGDEFARYGYMFEKQWSFNGNWNIGKYFTYWKLKDFWVSNLNVPDMYMDRLRFFLFGGVTVWRKPEYIGHINMYDNFE